MLDFFGVFNVFFFCFLGSKKCVSNTFFLYFCLGVFRMWIPALSMIFFALRLHLWRGRQPSALAPRLELKKQIKKDDEIPNSRVLMKRTFIGKYFKLKNFKPFSPWFLQTTNAMPQFSFSGQFSLPWLPEISATRRGHGLAICGGTWIDCMSGESNLKIAKIIYDMHTNVQYHYCILW